MSGNASGLTRVPLKRLECLSLEVYLAFISELQE
jgi:hypothetical protein